MFTGISELTSSVRNYTQQGDLTILEIEKPTDWKIQIGQSIAVNGVCLTVVIFNDNFFSVEIMPETKQKTSFGKEYPPTIVNLERAMSIDSRFEGHIVQGHVDTIGKVVAVEKTSEAMTIYITYNNAYNYLIVNKGSITIDGISLTVVESASGKFSVSLIPHTIKETTLGKLTENDMVNLEFDIIGKYITKLNKR